MIPERVFFDERQVFRRPALRPLLRPSPAFMTTRNRRHADAGLARPVRASPRRRNGSSRWATGRDVRWQSTLGLGGRGLGARSGRRARADAGGGRAVRARGFHPPPDPPVSVIDFRPARSEIANDNICRDVRYALWTASSSTLDS